MLNHYCIILKNLVLFTFSHIIFFQFLLSIILLYTSYKINNYINIRNKITILSLNINNTFIMSFITICYVLIYIGLFLYWRISNLFKTINLKSLIHNYYLYFDNNLIESIMMITLGFCVLLTVILIIRLLRIFFFFHFLTIHIILINYYRNLSPYNIPIRTIYQHLCDKIIYYEGYISSEVISTLIDFLAKYKNIDITKRYKKEYYNYADLIKKNINYYKHRKNIMLYIMIISIIYDIMFNNMIITKIYMILPIMFIMILHKKLVEIICFFQEFHCIIIYNYATNNVKKSTQEKIVLSNGFEIEKSDINEINEMLEKAYDIIDYYQPHLYSKPYITINTILLTLNSIGIIYITLYSNVIVQVTIDQHLFSIALNKILLALFLIQIYCYVYREIKVLFWIYMIINIIIIPLIIVIFIRHNVPLLFNEIIFDYYLTIRDSYTLAEKLLFIDEYCKYQTQVQGLSIEKQHHIFRLLKTVTESNYIEDMSIEDLKLYINAFIIMYQQVENVYDSLIEININKILNSLKYELVQKIIQEVDNRNIQHYRQRNEKFLRYISYILFIIKNYEKTTRKSILTITSSNKIYQILNYIKQWFL